MAEATNLAWARMRPMAKRYCREVSLKPYSQRMLQRFSSCEPLQMDKAVEEGLCECIARYEAEFRRGRRGGRRRYLRFSHVHSGIRHL